ncbi:hypothetical protein FD754_019968 [Muntiacus muntjak]|uniref:PRELI/MSF1 domain-containing protein n=1 Tax=Muntiacus muntjak TaxID=9888 RepID=A0A5N3V1L5_MUNMU|nr:hypothetical protein FD754_019968 [Muntiacus muntjak]
MVEYFLGQSMLWSSWDQVFAAFGQRYPNPCSKHVLMEDIVHREVTSDQKLLTKTNRMPRWAERLFPASVAHSVYFLEDSIVDPGNQTRATFTWDINHTHSWAEICQETWVSSSLFGISRVGFEYILAKLQGEAPPKTLVETAKEAKEKAKEMAVAATEKAKDLAGKAANKKQQQ